MMDPRDQALAAACPVLPVPRHGPLPAMANGQRVLVASNGWFMQTQLDWLDSIVALGGDAPRVPLPFGVMAERLRFSFGQLPIQLMERFIAWGRACLPNEAAAVLIYARQSGGLRLATCIAEEASPGRIRYRRPALASDETVAVDLHTHACAPAFWSREDDRDDQGIHVAGVFGHLDRARPSARFRLVLNGMYLPITPHPWLEEGADTPAPRMEPAALRGWRWSLRWPWRSHGGKSS